MEPGFASQARHGSGSVGAEQLPGKTYSPPRASALEVSEMQNEASQMESRPKGTKVLAAPALAGAVVSALRHMNMALSICREVDRVITDTGYANTK